MSRTISRAKDLFRRNQAQAMPEYTVVLAVVSSGSAFLLAQLGADLGWSAQLSALHPNPARRNRDENDCEEIPVE